MRITVLAGGVDGARFLLGIKAALGWDPAGPRPAASGDEVTAIVNTGSDLRVHNLHICPDLDACMYTASGVVDPSRGCGRDGESWAVAAELAAYGAEAPWLPLGDKDVATHLMRTRMLDAGYRLSAVTQALCSRFDPGLTLLPMTDDRVETHVVVPNPAGSDEHADPAQAADPAGLPDPAQVTGSLIAVHVQEWSIRYGAHLPALSITPIGAESATPAPGVIEAIEAADIVLVAPADPVTAIDTILAVPGIREALSDAAAPVVAISPIVLGASPSDATDASLAASGIERSAAGVAAHYGARAAGGLLDGFVLAEGDQVRIDGLAVARAPLAMTDPEASAASVARAWELVDVHR